MTYLDYTLQNIESHMTGKQFILLSFKIRTLNFVKIVRLIHKYYCNNYFLSELMTLKSIISSCLLIILSNVTAQPLRIAILTLTTGWEVMKLDRVKSKSIYFLFFPDVT